MGRDLSYAIVPRNRDKRPKDIEWEDLSFTISRRTNWYIDLTVDTQLDYTALELAQKIALIAKELADHWETIDSWQATEAIMVYTTILQELQFDEEGKYIALIRYD